MAKTEHIDVATISEGPGGAGRPGATVRLPVVELLTGRGFVTGKSGSGKSNTASVIAERLLDNGFGLLIVDVDGEYYGLKEEYEILHAGGDEECDVQVTPDHAEKLASLALEGNVPIILDVSSFLDGETAEALLTEVAKHLFAKAKKQKQPFLLLVEEVHEYIPENGSVSECGRMLIKIGKRGRKHGLGVCGISQRPADVKKDFITQCDWLVWHRLTWDNDTTVVRRVLDGEYASAVEDLDDGEGFLKTDWSGTVRRVQFDRKGTFDAGATPGLDDVERPELKSVSDDLVAELDAIGEDRRRREDRVADLRATLDEKNARIAELEAELQDARDLSRMADQFVGALLEEVRGSAPGRTEQERLRTSRTADAPDQATEPGTETSAADDEDGDAQETDAGDAFAAFAAMGDSADGTDAPAASAGDTADEATADEASSEDVAAAFAALDDVDDAEAAGSEGTVASEGTVGTDVERALERAEAAQTGSRAPASVGAEKPDFVRTVVEDLTALDQRARSMLAHYHDEGPTTPIGANLAAGGTGERTAAYAHNRQLRTAGFVEHVGRGKYRTRLSERLDDRADVALEDGVLRQYANYVADQVAGTA